MRYCSKRSQSRLSHQFFWLLFVILLIDTCIAVAVAGSHFKNEYVSLMQSRVVTLGSNLNSLLEEVLNLGLPIGSLEGIEKELKKTVMGELNAVYANVVDLESRILYSFPEKKRGPPFNRNALLPLMARDTQKTFLAGSAYNTFIPIRAPNSPNVVGGLNIGISRNTVLTKTIESLREMIITFIAFVFVAFVFVTLVLIYWITMRTMKPLEVLTDSAIALGKGDLTVRADVEAKNEIGSLAEYFNYMAEKLSQTINGLQ